MAQDFERNIARAIGTTAVTIFTANSDDAVVGINLANTITSQVKVSVFVTNSSADYYLVKNAPIPASAALQVLDGGAKFVLQSGDALKVQSDTATSIDAWVSRVDTISS
jgi:hypothetical protein|tara:strand:- start:890 stop:1216 length:327 start_codon:yes stop_codon:yes gene_type:complete